MQPLTVVRGERLAQVQQRTQQRFDHARHVVVGVTKACVYNKKNAEQMLYLYTYRDILIGILLLYSI